MSDASSPRVLSRNSNQALGIGQYAIDFLREGRPDPSVLERTTLFHTDAVLCGVSALALGTNAPVLLRKEALDYRTKKGVPVFGSDKRVSPEKAVVANCAAVREWDSNGTNFGYRPELGHTAGEFGHNDFYPVAVAAAQLAREGGDIALRGMVCLDEIRGRLAEVFSLKSYKIDHVVHGAIASAAVYGAILGATAEEIEGAIGMMVAHAIPWRAIRAGKQLSDSKGASAAISAEFAVLCMQRSMRGFLGPRDIFRNPESLFRQFEPTQGDSPFDLHLSMAGSDFAVMGMHFKLGLYEHQSAGALQGVIDLVQRHPELAEKPDSIRSITITAYEPAFGIIGDPAKRDPKTRQSADHSMLYIVSTLLRKAIERVASKGRAGLGTSSDDAWKALMLEPVDYGSEAIFNANTRAMMAKVHFEHGGPEFDRRYPEGIPTQVKITTDQGTHDSGLVMFPAGHARNHTANLQDILAAKFALMAGLGVKKGKRLVGTLAALGTLDRKELAELYDFELLDRGPFE
ncbi:MAG: MmgE/PrpD family protein [Planctomycetes bacterium]|nr:MmgE/PrpD family protein [Planctomycetota bacterium]